MRTLQDLLPEIERLGDREAIIHASGFRTTRWTYRDLFRHIQGVMAHFDERGLEPGDRILLWGENRPEWLATFWAAVARGVTVVPMDFRSSASLVSRVQNEVDAKLLVYGSTVGSAVDSPQRLELPRLALEKVTSLVSDEKRATTHVEPSDIVQILYTSGTTGEPKGVVHRHKNLVANLAPIRNEAQKYALYMRPFQPIRILDLLPSSHVFGQFTGLFVPVVIGGAVAFMDEVHPSAIIDMVRRERISVLSTVPRFLMNLRAELERRFELDATLPSSGGGVIGLNGGLHRWWRHRAIHSEFGWKFWAVLSGGARLPVEDEDFWLRLGFVVVQGYGMTETSSLVTTNHPFHPKRGSLGKVVGNQQIKLGDDGEILVRGDNVSLEYFGKEPMARDAWLHTGDIGEIRDDGVLYYKGRKKDVIVGADGVNVHPIDVEAALNRQPEVKEAVVVARASERGDVVHAVLLMETGDAETAVANANTELEAHQRVQEWSVWPNDDFPRTESTFKIRRHEILAQLAAPTKPESKGGSGTLSILAKQLGRDRDELDDSQRLSEELGLTSLDRVELLTHLERDLGRELSESDMAAVETVGELEAWAASAPTSVSSTPSSARSPLDGFARYARIAPIRFVRTIFREGVIRPLFHHYLPLTVEGNLEGVPRPVIFAANHQSNLDTLAVLTALPYAWRRSLAPVVQQEYFDAYLERTGSFRERISAALQYWLALVLVNAFPLPRSGTGTRSPMRFAGSLADRGYSILIFPEGRLTRDGAMGPFKPGVGLLAKRLELPVVPIHLEGLFAILSYRDRWPKAGEVRVRIGEPIHFEASETFEDAALRVEAAVKRLGRRSD